MKLDLKRLYKQKIVPSMIEEFGYKNIEQVPKLVKISVNRGIGEASKNSKELDASVQEMALMIGQQPTINKATKSVAGFKIREGMSIGASVTLGRGKNNYQDNLMRHYKIKVKTLLEAQIFCILGLIQGPYKHLML